MGEPRLCVCKDTGVVATRGVGGECPVHGGDACLVMVAASNRRGVSGWKEAAPPVGDPPVGKPAPLADDLRREMAIADGLAIHFHSDDPNTVRALGERVEHLTTALEAFVAWFDKTFPPAQSGQVPGVTLWQIASGAKSALAGEREGTPSQKKEEKTSSVSPSGSAPGGTTGEAK